MESWSKIIFRLLSIYRNIYSLFLFNRDCHELLFMILNCYLQYSNYSKTCVRKPPLKLTLVVHVERWLSYKGTCHVILLAKLHDMYLYKTDNFFRINHCLKSVSKVALLHRFHCNLKLGSPF